MAGTGDEPTGADGDREGDRGGVGEAEDAVTELTAVPAVSAGSTELPPDPEAQPASPVTPAANTIAAEAAVPLPSTQSPPADRLN
ncbi:hypothetical protein [Streptomyces sp. HUCO-GS316]|uniref:hypothetical protein n=1 Tax=Streptomyces sp. HUCO-GS316 TaxID=2692198 RepID=UPI001F2D92BC|nr:hypothetical protein [Streptomyces sp. HUCO-GS316]